jgi:hypothetical protein
MIPRLIYRVLRREELPPRTVHLPLGVAGELLEELKDSDLNIAISDEDDVHASADVVAALDVWLARQGLLERPEA